MTDPVPGLRGVCDLVAAEADSCDRAGTMTNAVLDAFYEADLFRLWVPRVLEGAELELAPSLEVFERLARADGSCGWIVAIGTGGGLFAAVLDPRVAAEIYGTPRSVIAGSGQPSGVARLAGEVYQVKGRWRYASGAPHATWFTANCLVEPAEEPGNAPVVRAMAFPKEDVEVITAWDVGGMRATASHDFAVEDCRVPERYSFSVFTDPPRHPGPLYRFPFGSIATLSFASVGIGIARHAIEAFAELARRKTPSGETSTLAEMGSAQVRMAEAEALVASARAYLYHAAQDAWATVAASHAASVQQEAQAQIAGSHAVAACFRATDGLYEAAGMSGVFRDSALGRCWRDLRVLSQNAAVSTLRLQAAGQALLAPDESS